MDELDLSIVIPFYEEEGNVEELCRQIDDAMNKASIAASQYEVICIDDGSKDNTLQVLREMANRYPNYRIVSFKRNYGQTAAMSAGFDLARGKIIVSMDGDLQNSPYDITKLLTKIDEGFDVVNGWRHKRQDKYLTRVLPSRMANKLISFISGVHLHDYGCSLKAYKKEYVKNIRLFGEMHRFIPIYAFWEGARITELPVDHFPRVAGKSKYGLIRTFKVILDLMTVKFLGDDAVIRIAICHFA